MLWQAMQFSLKYKISLFMLQIRLLCCINKLVFWCKTNVFALQTRLLFTFKALKLHSEHVFSYLKTMFLRFGTL